MFKLIAAPSLQVFKVSAVKVITSKTYNQVEKEIKELGVEIRPMFYSVINHPHLQGIDIEHIKKIEDNIIMLPSSPLITLEEQKKVISCLIQVI